MELQPYNFMGINIRVNDDEGEPKFMLADLCKALNIKNPSMSKDVIFPEYLKEKVTFESNTGRKTKANAVTEPGLYQLIMRSNKDEAIKFQKFVFEEILPKIRRKQFFLELEANEGTELGKSFARIMATR